MSIYSIKLLSEKRQNLEHLAVLFGCEHNGKPSVPKLITLIADGDIALIKNQKLDNECTNHQNNINDDSFYERLVLAIAQGLSANPNTTDYSASHFIETVENRVNAYFDDYPLSPKERADEIEKELSYLSEDIQVDYP